ncbi:S66 family peptidase [Paenibacillus flagellatus]|uniref:LD-carboxypeptidase n=1 Tax=Paenibacillus flagellatus TaxID=2211139 RepID=A0A2V5KB89_9BACL|nr:S66 peptidase family protein [Paenibacillus flagellatus]PYI55213.1 LD-carboxypeptidase [Paenibacillus flagellatus]
MIFPILKQGATIGVTAPSSGVQEQWHGLLRQACGRMEAQGFHVVIGDTAWTQSKAKSSPAASRADELNAMLRDDRIDAIIPPWGGELAIETIEHLDFGRIESKWVLGYSDISVLLLAITLKTGIATAHGTNLIDLRGEYSDQTTAMWKAVLSTPAGESILQRSSPNYQKEWDHANASPCVFHLTEPTRWKTVSGNGASLRGRLLGGCIDVIRHLIGTPYGDVRSFQDRFIQKEPIVWYLENCELSTTDLRRSLVQMRLAGWFDRCAGVLFGRSGVHRPVDHYSLEDVYGELSSELRVPVVYDIDCGHLPPQMTFVNGAYAEIDVDDGAGTVLQHFIP